MSCGQLVAASVSGGPLAVGSAAWLRAPAPRQAVSTRSRSPIRSQKGRDPVESARGPELVERASGPADSRFSTPPLGAPASRPLAGSPFRLTSFLPLLRRFLRGLG